MKKTLLLVVFALLTMVGIAKPVDQGTARRVAETYMQAAGMRNVAALADITSQTPFTAFYVFAAEEGGFILVSADDCVLPVLGYSLTTRFEVKDMPVHLRRWLESYEEQIVFYSRRYSNGPQYEGDPVREQWQQLAAGRVPAPMLPTAVAPLVSTTWNQSPLYNDLCPFDSAANRPAVAGCTAIAMSQIMKYWNHPAVGYGSRSYVCDNGDTNFGTLSANFGATTYDWTNMPTALTGASSATEINAVATLVYHVGVSVNMRYSVSGSGAATDNAGRVDRASAENALYRYFKYQPTLHTIYMGDYSNEEWGSLLRAELDANRPMLYTGYDTSAGHAFVFDGYDNNGQFHINWGWGGWCDGYYIVGDLHPASGGIGGNSTYTFNLSNFALIGIQPMASWNTSATTTVTATAAGGTGCTVSGAGTYGFGDTVMLRATAAEGYYFTGWSDGYKYNPRSFIATGSNINLTAQFAALAGDTLSYCSGNRQITSFGTGDYGDDKYWGIRLPASAIENGKTLTAVQFYAAYATDYTLVVYEGTTVVATVPYTALQEGWQTITLTNPVVLDGTQPVKISFYCNTVAYPAALTYYSGTNNGLLWGNDLEDISDSWDYTFMIKGLFYTPASLVGDTLDYCGDRPHDYNWGNNYVIDWGVMFPAARVTGHTYLSEVMLYVENTGTYTLNVWQGGATAPATQLYSQTVTFAPLQTGWQHIALVEPVVLDATQNLWVTFSAPQLLYPASACAYAGEPNSDWISLDGGITWGHLADYDYNNSWMIRCVTSQTLPPPVVHINGYDQAGVAEEVHFSVTAPSDATVAWTLQEMMPSTGTGTSVQGVWYTPGTYNVIATATTAYGISRDTLTVRVVDYTQGDTVSYCLDRPVCGNVGYNETGTYWGIMLPAAYLSGRNYLNNVLLYVGQGGNYTMNLYQGGTQAPEQLVYTHTYTFDSTQIGWFGCTPDSLFQINTAQNLWVVFYHPDIVYPAMGCTYMGNPNSDWISADGTNWDHLNTVAPSLPYSWLIQCVTSHEVLYTLNAFSGNSSMGTVSGGGIYPFGTSVTIEAHPYEGYKFFRWSDGSATNPRTVTVTGNATYVAHFVSLDGIDDVTAEGIGLYPNPATASVTLSGLTVGATVTLVDLSGRTVMTFTAREKTQLIDITPLSRGTYFVRVTDARNAAVYKLIVQ